MDLSTFRADVVKEARNNLGYGPTWKRFLETIGAKPDQNWCAIFGTWCIGKGFLKQGYSSPDWLWRRKYTQPEPGAKRLLKNIAAAKGDTYQGRWLTADEVGPGDFVVWNRTKIPGDWRGHFGIVVDRRVSGFTHVSGNAGKPSKVRERRGYFEDPMLWRFAGFR